MRVELGIGRRGQIEKRPDSVLSLTARPAAAGIGAEGIPDLPGLKGSPRVTRFRP